MSQLPPGCQKITTPAKYFYCRALGSGNNVAERWACQVTAIRQAAILWLRNWWISGLLVQFYIHQLFRSHDQWNLLLGLWFASVVEVQRSVLLQRHTHKCIHAVIHPVNVSALLLANRKSATVLRIWILHCGLLQWDLQPDSYCVCSNQDAVKSGLL